MDNLKNEILKSFENHKNEFLKLKKNSTISDRVGNGKNHSIISEKLADEITEIINRSDIEYNEEIKNYVTSVFQDFGRLLL